MKKLEVKDTKSFPIDTGLKNISNQLTHDLYQFLNRSYHLADLEEFKLLILQAEKKGELTVLFGKNQEIAGFSRTYMQTMRLNKKQVTTYIALIYLNPDYENCPTITSAGLTQAVKYKLDHPQDEIIYVAFADTPSTYEFIYQLSDAIYPKPSQRVPEQILKIVNSLKNQNGWKSTNSHPMVINSLLVPLRSNTSDFSQHSNELSDFYLESNPDYMQGSTLLIYMPLHLANINYSLNNLDFTNTDKYEQFQFDAVLPNQKSQ